MWCYDMFFVPKYVIVTTYTAAVKIASHAGFFLGEFLGEFVFR